MANFTFPVQVFGELEKYNEVLSKARCRIFYKYGNRNGTYIKDEVAEQILSTLPYAPIKGIYEEYDDDYTDHGKASSEGRIYGIVPQEPNVAWEKHIDEDGIEREYATTDVLLFTELYQEASDIVGKAQSMEFYQPTFKFHPEFIDGKKYQVIDYASFLGLQVLGDKVEPCFEGASFYTLQTEIQNIMQKIKDYSYKGGNTEMPQIKFKLSDAQKYDAIWKLLNTHYTEEDEWTCDYTINQVYDDYALCFNYEAGQYERVYYTKNDADDSLVLGDRVRVYVVDVTEKERDTLNTLAKLNGDTYELVQENLINADKNAQDCKEYALKIEDLNTTISTLNTEAQESSDKYAIAQQTIDQLNEEVTTLQAYKNDVETEQKKQILAEYTNQLSDTVLDEFSQNLDNYSVTELDKELAYTLKKTCPSFFSKNSNEGIIPKIVDTGIAGILSKYEQN